MGHFLNKIFGNQYNKNFTKALLASFDEEISVLNEFSIDCVFSICSLILIRIIDK